MPLLDRTGKIADRWTRAETVRGGHVILPPEPFALAAATPGVDPGAIGLHVDPDMSWDEVGPLALRAALVSVGFPSFADGRGFSWARRLRAEGFAGRLRAAGPLISDQFPDLLACGFDEVEVTGGPAARQPVADWRAALAATGPRYQAGYAGRASILAARGR